MQFITTYFLIGAIIIGLLNFNKFKSSISYSILGIVILALVTDLIALLYIGEPNIWFYNIAVPVQQCFIFIIYGLIVNNKKWRGFFYLLALLSIVSAKINYTFGQGALILNTFNILFFGLIIAISSYIILRNDILNIQITQPRFLGFLTANALYYVIGISTLASLPLLGYSEIGKTLIKINQLAYCAWSTSIAAGFIWMKK